MTSTLATKKFTRAAEREQVLESCGVRHWFVASVQELVALVGLASNSEGLAARIDPRSVARACFDTEFVRGVEPSNRHQPYAAVYFFDESASDEGDSLAPYGHASVHGRLGGLAQHLIGGSAGLPRHCA